MGESKVFFVGLADPEDDALGVGEHHVISQDQIVFRADDVEEALQIDIVIKEPEICRL